MAAQLSIFKPSDIQSGRRGHLVRESASTPIYRAENVVYLPSVSIEEVLKRAKEQTC